MKSERPIFVGLLGEYGVRTYIRQRFSECPPIDLRLRPWGDCGTDLEVFGLTMQIKLCEGEKGRNLIRVRDSRGRSRPIVAKSLVFSHWDECRTVYLRGWCWAKELRELPEVEAWAGHRNIEPPSSMLKPMSALVDELHARRELRNGNH